MRTDAAPDAPASPDDFLGRRASPSRATWVYELLRARIVEGHIRPNTRLVETALAEELDISRTPVREGLQRLATAGYVIGGRGGWVVREHTAREIQEVFETRAALEGYASRLAAVRATPDELDGIARTHGAEGNRLLRMSRGELVVVNDLFHNAIIAASGNRRLIEMIRQNRDFYFNYRMADMFSEQEIEASVLQHESIMGALWDRDGHRAEMLTRLHILATVPILLPRLGPPPDGELPELVIDEATPTSVRSTEGML